MRFKVRADESLVTGVRLLVLLTVLLLASAMPALNGPAQAAERPLTLVVLGDSLVAGYGLAPGEAFPEKLGEALKARGHDVTIVNAGVSGDTSAGGLERLDWSVPEETDAAIVELGANDALRGFEPEQTRKNLEAIVGGLKARGIEVLLAGMLAPPNMGPDYGKAFNAIYPELAKQLDVALYPFFLDGVAAQADLNQSDGMHPNAAGVAVIVERFLPAAEELLQRSADGGAASGGAGDAGGQAGQN